MSSYLQNMARGKKKNPEPFENVIRILKKIYAFPKSRKENFNLFLFVKFSCLSSFSIDPTMLGLMGHFYMTLQNGQILRNEQIDNIMVQLQMSILIIFFCTFFLLGNKIVVFMDKLKTYNFGRPENIDQVVRDHERIVLLSYRIAFCLCFLYGLDTYYTKAFCDGRTLLEDSRFICGAALPIFFPIQLYTVLEISVKVVAVVGLMMYFPCGLMIPTFAIGSIDLIVVRMRHLKKLLGNIDFSEKAELNTIKPQLRNCIIYYNEIKSLSNEMNNTVGYLLLPEYFLITMIIGLFEYFAIKTGDIVTALRFFGWLAMQTYVCFKAQTLIDESEELRNYVFTLPWYSIPAELRSTFLLFVGSVQRPICFMTKPLVILNKDFLLRVLKGSYSLLMFLQTWSM